MAHHYDLDDQDEHIHIHAHDERPSRAGVAGALARGLFVGALLIALPIGGYYLGVRTHPKEMHAQPIEQQPAGMIQPAAHGADPSAPPADFAPGAGVTNPAMTAPQTPVGVAPSPAAPGVAGPPAPAGLLPTCDPQGEKDKEADKAKTPGPNEGTLVVECVPSCQEVTIDGKSMGPSPLTQVILPAGKHELTASFGQGALRKHEAVVTPGQMAHVGLAPVAASDEHVVIDDSEAGCEPPYWLQADGTRIAKPACATH